MTFQEQLQRILADRNGPEAQALLRELFEFVARRAAHLARGRCRGLLAEADVEEVVSEVMMALMQGALGRFRGDDVRSLHAFVRTMTDRTATRRAQRRLRDRRGVEALEQARATGFQARHHPSPDEQVEVDADTPLAGPDAAYLEALVHAGSKAELARREGVSRAAVSQRVQRIKDRLAQLSPPQRASHGAWMQRIAHEALHDA